MGIAFTVEMGMTHVVLGPLFYPESPGATGALEDSHEGEEVHADQEAE